MDIKISPSVMCADLSRLGEQIEELDAAGVDMFHWDIMDGVYVHNMALTPAVMAACRRYTGLPFDVHLGLVDPASYIPDAAQAGADIISVQFETTPHIFRAVRQIRALGRRAGVVVNPITPVELLEPLVSELDMVTLMTVDFGFAGQSIVWPALEKARTLRRWIGERGLALDIQVDGQVNALTIPRLVAARPNVLVVGTSGLFAVAPTLSSSVNILRQQIVAAQDAAAAVLEAP